MGELSTDTRMAVELAARNRRLDLLARIAGDLILDKSLDERLQTAFADIAHEIGADYYFNFLIDESDPAEMRLASSGGLSAEQQAAFARIGVGAYLCGRVAANRQAVVVDDLDKSDDPACAGVIGLDGKSYAGFPLIAEGKLIGTVSFASVDQTHFTEDQLALMRTVADLAAAALDRRRSEAALRESEARFRNMADHAPVMMWVTDPNGHCTYLNRAWYDFTGQTEAEAEGLGWLEATHPDDKAEAERIFLDANARGAAFRLEYRLRRADGEYRWAIDAAAPRFGENGEFLGYIGSVIDIDERKEAAESQALLARELHHRVKNNLATVQSIINFTLRTSDSMEAFQKGIGARISSLARSHSLLMDNNWNGAPLREILCGELESHDDGKRLTLNGPHLHLPADTAVPLAMAIHELTTNALKYGALSVAAGRLDVQWVVKPVDAGRRLHIDWIESGGPQVDPPSRRGFGTTLLEKLLSSQLGGQVDLAYLPEGVRVQIQAPV